MGKRNRQAYAKRQEERANKIIKTIFLSLVALAVVLMVVFAINA